MANSVIDKFNLDNAIPENRLVKIFRSGNVPIFESPLILDDDFSIKTSSKFGQLWDASPNNFLSLLSSTFNVPSGQFALQGAQIWQSTDPIDIDIKVNLEMDTDPYIDVIAPAYLLVQTCLPKINNNTATEAEKFVTEQLNLKLQTLIPPGPNINTLINLMKKDKNKVGINSGLLAGNDGRNGVYNVKIGFATFYNVIIKSVEPTFSKTVAMSLSKMNKLYPCRAELSISMTTMEVATTDMIVTIEQNN